MVKLNKDEKNLMTEIEVKSIKNIPEALLKTKHSMVTKAEGNQISTHRPGVLKSGR